MVGKKCRDCVSCHDLDGAGIMNGVCTYEEPSDYHAVNKDWSAKHCDWFEPIEQSDPDGDYANYLVDKWLGK